MFKLPSLSWLPSFWWDLPLAKSTIVALWPEKCTGLVYPMARWTCIAEHESGYNTKAVGSMNYNGSRDYGIFQINNYYWCSPPSGAFSYDECHIKCDDFLVDSIEPAVKCARLVLRQQGWSAWSTWHFCDGRLPSIDDCF
ncbi:hypothetical protein DOY81_007729 [Sarcophaga bullata]|nr:hypothetical protein DOY81_007729 [Sarcophaga bullata]